MARSADLPLDGRGCPAWPDDLGYPLVVGPSFTMGGLGSGLAHDGTSCARMAGAGAAASPTTEVLIEESILGWKEFELEVMRDHDDNVVIVCSIENLDPMGVHTGDSITVAPAMTLTDREYQRMRDVGRSRSSARSASTPAAATSSSPSNPRDGEMLVIEMNPRVSRSSRAARRRRPASRSRKIAREARRRLHARRDPERHHARRRRRRSSRPSTTSS